MLARYRADGHASPETVALVLWGTDNLKSEGGPIGQALALVGAKPRFDAYGRLCGAELIPLEELGRPRIDVVVTLSGIFRDLLPLQTRLLAEACWLAATADEPEDANFVRKHALAYPGRARLRSRDRGAARVLQRRRRLRRQCRHADRLRRLERRGRDLRHLSRGARASPTRRKGVARRAARTAAERGPGAPSTSPIRTSTASNSASPPSIIISTASAASAAPRRARAAATPAPIYISDQTRGEGKVRSLTEQVALETRTRMLNPKWYEGMLKHGYEGVRQIEAHVTNTMGWSATTGQVEPWVYEQITRTFVLDPEMRATTERSSIPPPPPRLTNRMLEAHERGYWRPDAETLASLRDAGDEMEDRLEGVVAEVAA